MIVSRKPQLPVILFRMLVLASTKTPPTFLAKLESFDILNQKQIADIEYQTNCALLINITKKYRYFQKNISTLVINFNGSNQTEKREPQHSK